jgi:hypothetical protein
MTRRAAALVLLTLVLAACGGIPATSAQNAEPTVEELVEQFELSPAELEEIRSVAERHGWTLAEAVGRLEWQPEFGAFVEELQETFPYEFAGAGILGDVGPRSVYLGFRSTVPPEVRDDPRLRHLDVEFREMLGYSEDELARQTPDVHYAVLDAGFPSVSSAPDMATGVIEVVAVRRETDRGKSDGEIIAGLPAVTRAGNVHITFVDELPGSDDQ